MKSILLLFVLLILYSCLPYNEVIYYEYNDITITRVDNGNKIYLYYGKFDKGNYPDNYIMFEYSGFDGLVQAYLTFLPNGETEIRRTAGFIKKIGNEPNLNIIEEDVIKSIDWFESIENSYNNTIKVRNLLMVEKRINLKNKSKVKAIYPR